MRSRWFHPPLLHSPHEGFEKKPSWIELFYDLIFVAAFIQLGNGLSDHVSFSGSMAFGALFVPLWVAWTGFTNYENRFNIDDFLHRILVFLQMFAVGAMAVSVSSVLKNKPYIFATAAAIAQLMVAVMYLRAWMQTKEARSYSLYWAVVYGIGTVSWLISTVLPGPWCYVLWGLGIIAVLGAPFSAQSRMLADRFPSDAEHLSERFGLLTIIVLGESFVKVLSSLAEKGASVATILQASVILLITCSIWWIYFDDIAGSELKKGRFNALIWLYAHLPLQASITAVGVAVKYAVVKFKMMEVAPVEYRVLLSCALGFTLLSTAAIDSVTERRQAEMSDRLRVNVRIASGILILLLAPVGSSMNALTYLIIVTGICAAQVVFDMMMAPFETKSEHFNKPVSTKELARKRLAGEATGQTGRRRRDVSEAVRKGIPSELRRDLYFYYMEGSWNRFFVSITFLYLVANVFFGCLYMLVPGSIDRARPDSFFDAFFFSVQTMSTIGYGGMSPLTAYGNTIVTIESIVGLLGVALVTGLMFAKASRPKASVLFSNKMVKTEFNNKPALIFRVGNAKGSDIVDASMTLTVLKEEITPEGHHIRKLHDIGLVRSRSPLFALTWTIMHILDETSPLHETDWSKPDDTIMAFVATIIGHDGVYGQTVYARHLYYPEDITRNEMFVDVISELNDGRMMVDYTRFHDTAPVAKS